VTALAREVRHHVHQVKELSPEDPLEFLLTTLVELRLYTGFPAKLLDHAEDAKCLPHCFHTRIGLDKEQTLVEEIKEKRS
jgi:hypothetical protein